MTPALAALRRALTAAQPTTELSRRLALLRSAPSPLAGPTGTNP